MAIEIKSIPILKSEEAKVFVEKANKNASDNKQTINFSQEVKSAESILAKSKK